MHYELRYLAFRELVNPANIRNEESQICRLTVPSLLAILKVSTFSAE